MEETDKKKIQLIPYCEVDGVRNFSDSQIQGFYNRMELDGTTEIVFYEGTISSREEFLRCMKHVENYLYIIHNQKEMVGITWLNRFENHTARQHFCLFKEYWGDSVEIGKAVLSIFMHMQDKAGNYFFDLLTGFVPVWNQRAIKFALKCGGKTHGIIPNAIWNQSIQKSEDAVFIYYTRGDT